MLQQSMEEIAQCAAKEVSCLGSSVESLSNSEDQFSEIDNDIHEEDDTIKFKTGQESSSATEEEQENAETERTRELRHPLSKLITHGHKSHSDGLHTPPYLSPGITRRIALK